MRNKELLINKIQKLKKEKNAIIIAHNYERGEIQDIADFVGDSFELSRKCVGQKADLIVFCGVHFMAEIAAILSPDKTVLLPEIDAGCHMADMVTASALRDMKKKHPNAAVVSYVNTTANVKAETTICCTSSNAARIVNSLEEDEIIFTPDKNLANFVAKQTDKKIIPWEGYCPTHHQILTFDVELMMEKYPNAEFLAHPECREEVLDMTPFVYSTTGIIQHAKRSNCNEFIIGTECGIIHRLQKENPNKKFYPISDYAVCPHMKMITLETLLASLQENKYIIKVPEDIRVKAVKSLERMLEVGINP